MATEYAGTPTEIGFNPVYLIDMLKAVKASKLDFEFGQPNRPGLFKNGADFLYVVMPINLG